MAWFQAISAPLMVLVGWIVTARLEDRRRGRDMRAAAIDRRMESIRLLAEEVASEADEASRSYVGVVLASVVACGGGDGLLKVDEVPDFDSATKNLGGHIQRLGRFIVRARLLDADFGAAVEQVRDRYTLALLHFSTMEQGASEYEYVMPDLLEQDVSDFIRRVQGIIDRTVDRSLGEGS